MDAHSRPGKKSDKKVRLDAHGGSYILACTRKTIRLDALGGITELVGT